MQTRRRTTPVTRLLRTVAALTIVLGIFGMHALSHHGTTHEPAPTAVTTSGMPAKMTMGSGSLHDQYQAASAVLRNGAPGTQSSSANGHRAAPGPAGHGTGTGGTGEPGHSLGDMVMLCVAMLVAAAGLLASLGLLRRVPRVWAVLFPAIITRVTRQVAPRGAGPPSVWQFSVIRC